MKKYAVFQKDTKQLMNVLIGLIFTALSIFIFAYGLLTKETAVALIGFLGLAFFGTIGALTLKVLLRGKILVLLTGKGFYDYTTPVSPQDQCVPWSLVEEIKFQDKYERQVISVFLKDAEAFYEALPIVRRKAAEESIKAGHGAVNIILENAKDETPDNLMMEMRKYLRFAREQEG